MEEDYSRPTVLKMVGLVTVVVASIILVFFAIGYALGKLVV